MSPVMDVVALSKPTPTARKAATLVAMLECSPQRGRNRARPCSDFDRAAGLIVAHHHARRVARNPLGRFRGNARTPVEDRLAWRIGILQNCGVHMDDDLIPFGWSTWIDTMVQGGLRDQRQRIGLLLRWRARFRGNVAGCR